MGYGFYYPYPYYRPAYWRRRGVGAVGRGGRLGPGRLGGDDRQRLPPLGIRDRGHAALRRLRRLDGQRVARTRSACPTTRAPGTLAAGQRAAASNVYTGNYAYGGRGAAVNTQTGASVSGGRVTAGNAYTGNEVHAGHVEGTNASGQSGSAAWARGEDGGAARIGDDVYAGKDGNVYKRNDDGGWDQVEPKDGQWKGVEDRERTSTLDQQQRARRDGTQRTGGYDSARASGYGQGYRTGGGGTRSAGGARARVGRR